MTTALKIEPDPLLVEAGECFMFLLWAECLMVDFIALAEGDRALRDVYNTDGPHPRNFSKRRLTLKAFDLSVVVDMFLQRWPQWESDSELYHCLHRVAIWRNALGHAQVQPFRGYLLYHPRSWKRIKKHMRCGRCHEFLENCPCPPALNVSDPPCMILRRDTIDTIYLDIKELDRRCFLPTAVSLDVKYLGIAWADAAVTSHRPVSPNVNTRKEL